MAGTGVFIPKGIEKKHVSLDYIHIKSMVGGGLDLFGFWCGMPLYMPATPGTAPNTFETLSWNKRPILLIGNDDGTWTIRHDGLDDKVGPTIFERVSSLSKRPSQTLSISLSGIYKYDDNDDFFYVTAAYRVSYPGTLEVFDKVDPPSRAPGGSQLVTVGTSTIKFFAEDELFKGEVTSGGKTRTCTNLIPFARTWSLLQPFYYELPPEFRGIYYKGDQFVEQMERLQRGFGDKYNSIYYAPEVKFAIGAATYGRMTFTIENGVMTHANNAGNANAIYIDGAVLEKPHPPLPPIPSYDNYEALLGIAFCALIIIAIK